MAAFHEDDDVELGECENDAFIPNSNLPPKSLKQHNFITSRIIPRVFAFLETVQRVKIALFLLACFLFLFAWVALANSVPSVSVSEESFALQAKVLKELERSKIPDYVITHAPLVYLDKGDLYHPSDLTTHIKKTHPTLNFTKIEDKSLPDPLTLDNLDTLNDFGGKDVYLTSTKNLIDLPKYLKGKKPDSKTLQTHHATTAAVIVVEKGDGIVDAFYMYFYTFNAGPSALGHTAGNHLGDWEHNMIRFKNGKPQAIWYSQHEYGAAYTFSTVQKAGLKPLVYSSKGSHANYAKPGRHDLHDQCMSPFPWLPGSFPTNTSLSTTVSKVPAHIVFDHTSAGKLWDPTLSAYYYTYSTSASRFTPARERTPVNWLYYKGNWGDPEYPDEKKGQEIFHGFHKWTGGPQGPWFKHLDREEVCWPTNTTACRISDKL